MGKYVGLISTPATFAAAVLCGTIVDVDDRIICAGTMTTVSGRYVSHLGGHRKARVVWNQVSSDGSFHGVCTYRIENHDVAKNEISGQEASTS